MAKGNKTGPNWPSKVTGAKSGPGRDVNQPKPKTTSPQPKK